MLSLTLRTARHAAIVLACDIAGKACTQRQSSLNLSVGANALRTMSVISFPAGLHESSSAEHQGLLQDEVDQRKAALRLRIASFLPDLAGRQAGVPHLDGPHVERSVAEDVSAHIQIGDAGLVLPPWKLLAGGRGAWGKSQDR